MSFLFPYLGGKIRTAKKMASMLPDHFCYVEVFTGSGSFFFAKPQSENEVINDLNREIITLYRCLQYHPDELYRHFKFLLASRAEFERQKQLNPEHLTDIQRAVRFLFLQRLSFGGCSKNPSFGVQTRGAVHNGYFNNFVWLKSDLDRVWERLAGVQIECLDFRELIPRYDRPYTLFYLDPPYWGMPYYAHNFVEQDFHDLAGVLAGIRGKFLMSINDTPEIREIFAPFKIYEIQLIYSINAKNEEKPGESHTELIITNYEPSGQQRLF